MVKPQAVQKSQL